MDAIYSNAESRNETAESQDSDTPQVSDVPEVSIEGTVAAAPSVVTMSTPMKLDGFGQSPAPLDVARRACRLFSYTGPLRSTGAGERKLFIIPVNALVMKNRETTTDNYILRTPNMFEVLSATNLFAYGSLDYVIDVHGANSNTVATVHFIPGVPTFEPTTLAPTLPPPLHLLHF